VDRRLSVVAVFAVSLVGCASQGPTLERGTFVRPPPVPTRPGVGAPAVGQPGPHARGVPRSPDKRVLPPTREPGIWASDRPFDPFERMRVFGILVPMHPEDPTDEQLKPLLTCAEVLRIRAQKLGLTDAIWKLPGRSRLCLAARLYDFCIKTDFERVVDEGIRNEGLTLPLYGPFIRNLSRKAGIFHESHCGPEAPDDAAALAGQIEATWDTINPFAEVH
jgi:hypothetical protein